jgi:hypothetical protein
MIFQFDELVDLYRVARSDDLEENLNFCITDNIFVNVDVEKLNDVLSFNRYTQVNRDNNNDEINVKNCDVDEDDSIDEEKDNSD